MTSPEDLKEAIKKEALRLGFRAVGIAPPLGLQAREADLTQWLSNGFAGQLGYMEQFFKRKARFLADFDDMRSVVVLAAPYGNGSVPPNHLPGTGRIARYAWGRDYHRVLQKRLKSLEGFIRSQVKDPLRIVRTVDTGPVLERALAEAAGIGFFGKNTCLILPKGGSFIFLAALLTNLELPPNQPIRWDCGACTLCLEACPTQAFVKPYELDARRCISYLTIELKGALDPKLRPLVKDWIFGCDICQEVCPYNAQSLRVSWPEFRPEAGAGGFISLQELLACRTEEAFLQRFAGTPLTRAKREGLLRNAAVAAGNLRDSHLSPILQETVHNDPSPIVREQAAWALDQIRNKVRPGTL